MTLDPTNDRLNAEQRAREAYRTSPKTKADWVRFCSSMNALRRANAFIARREAR